MKKTLTALTVVGAMALVGAPAAHATEDIQTCPTDSVHVFGQSDKAPFSGMTDNELSLWDDLGSAWDGIWTAKNTDRSGPGFKNIRPAGKFTPGLQQQYW